MTFLLDVNVLIALVDPMHTHHEQAHEWFAQQGSRAWATCPLTQNAVLRIVGNPRYPNTPGTCAQVAPVLQGLCALAGHVFWPDDISLLDTSKFDTNRLLNFNQITDSYLLALALAHGGQLATFDQRLVVDAVHGGIQGLCLIAV